MSTRSTSKEEAFLQSVPSGWYRHVGGGPSLMEQGDVIVPAPCEPPDGLEQLDWSVVYLLAWHAPDGQRHLSSWKGDLPIEDILVIGARWPGPPMWDARVVPTTCNYRMPALVGVADKIAYATRCGGIYAFGWILDEPMPRRLQIGEANPIGRF